MSPQEALDELGLSEGSSFDDLKRAHKKRARETHPDSNRNDPAANQKFQRVQNAYELLKKQFGPHDRKSDDDRSKSHSAGGGATHESAPVDERVRKFMSLRGIVVLADGFLYSTKHIKHPETPEQFYVFLQQPDITVQSVVDDLLLDSDIKREIGGQALVTTAVRRVVAADSKVRTAAIFAPLLRTLGPTGKEQMLEQLADLASVVFTGPPILIARALLHFVWQVHRKMLNLEVDNHVMPFLWSAEQGAGKSTFVRKFCAPLKELFSPPIALTDFIDPRFSGALDYAVAFIDESHEATAIQVDQLKLVLSTDELLRRQFGTSKKQRVRQKTTAIFTGNGPAHRFFKDPSGHRRFLSIEQVDSRQRPDLRDAINSFNFERVWRSVGPKDPSPIMPVLAEVRAYQASSVPLNPLLAWLIDLDVEADEMLAIKFKDGFRSDPLRLIFNETKGVEWSRHRFSVEMETYFAHPLCPFGSKRDINGVTYYRLKSD